MWYNVAMRYFKDSEFKCCPDCDKGRGDMQPSALFMIDEARRIAKTPFNLNSSIRCEHKNQVIGGKPESAHLGGWAFDIAVPDSRSRHHIINGLLDAGFNRIGIYPTFIHADCDPEKPQSVIWAGL